MIADSSAPALDDRQTEAIALDADASLAVVGPAGSGKSVALVRRALRLATLAPAPVLVTAPSEAGLARIRSALGDAGHANVVVTSLAAVAFAILNDGARAPVREIDEARASLVFERAGAELFALEWTEFITAEIDPEIAGMRAPERFAAAAFRLIRKLRAAAISPKQFERAGRRGVIEFYGRPPNFASPGLVLETPAKYRDSLRVTPAELDRQRSRETDLVKILIRLYASYVETMAARGELTPVDAVYEAAARLHADAPARERAAGRYAAALVDDAQDLTGAELRLLETMFGAHYRGVTLAGDAAQSTRGFADGARGAEAFARVATTIELHGDYRTLPVIARVAERIRAPQAGTVVNPLGEAHGVVDTYRGTDGRDEARFVAAEIARLVHAGTPPGAIAVIVRHLACAHVYVDAVLARDVPVDVAGRASLYDFPAVGDALAALWSAVDPFRHDHLLRNLEAPWVNLSDASIALLCNAGPSPQQLLFELPDDAGEDRAPRRDRDRALRLGRNVTRGDRDDELSDEARTRIVAFRRARERWEAGSRTLDVPVLARTILGETVLAAAGSDARGRFDTLLVERLIESIDACCARDPLASLEDVLIDAERLAASEADLLAIAPRDPDAVRVYDVEAAKGATFDVVFIVDAKAGAWPRYYVPDAFLFTPKAGMIPKDNVGDGRAARTAKFTEAMFRYRFGQKYVEEERRAFACAATRARNRLFVSASGRATRGVTTPELEAEVARALGAM